MNSNIYSIKKGEKFLINVKLKNRDEDEPIDLTNSTITIQIKDELQDDTFILERNIDTTTDLYEVGQIIAPQEGIFAFRFNDKDYEQLMEERIYYMTIWWNIPEEGFSKVVSSNCNQVLKFKVCYA